MDNYLGIAGNHSGAIFDKLLELNSASDSLATTGSSVVKLGDGLVDANLVIDVPEKVAAATTLALAFSNTADFTTSVTGITVSLAKDQEAGRIITPFRNDPAGTPLGFVKLIPSAAITVGAFITK